MTRKPIGNAENAGAKQRGRPFQKGVSGNPRGKPPGTRNRTTLAVQALLDGEAEVLTRKCIELALRGDSTALRLCMERLAPAPKDRPIQLPIPAAHTAHAVSRAVGSVIEAVLSGTITPGEGNALASLLEAHRRGIETADLENRIERLEKVTAEEAHR